MTIEYLPATPRPNDGGEVAMPDWVGALSGVPDFMGQGPAFFAGCYDGAVRVVAGDQTLAQEISHSGAVKALASVSSLDLGVSFAVSGGQDRSLCAWTMGSAGLEVRSMTYNPPRLGSASFLDLPPTHSPWPLPHPAAHRRGRRRRTRELHRGRRCAPRHE